jgi:hypothetical protein
VPFNPWKRDATNNFRVFVYADEDDVWVPVSRYTQAVLGIQTNDIEKVKDIYSKNYEAICGFLNKDRRDICKVKK